MAARAMRASDDRRDRTVGLLGRRFSEGCLSTETFELRAELAYASRDQRQLEELTRDLPPARGLRAALARARERLESALRRPRDPAPVIVPEPPRDAAAEGLVIGRDPGCALVLQDPTVSRRHAELRLEDDRWVVADLGSSNGTRVNGWRVRRATIGAGDELMLGDQRMILRPPSWRTAPERPVRS
jgi:FHA domain-containing protein/uncharacterized protein DUF1707